MFKTIKPKHMPLFAAVIVALATWRAYGPYSNGDPKDAKTTMVSAITVGIILCVVGALVSWSRRR